MQNRKDIEEIKSEYKNQSDDSWKIVDQLLSQIIDFDFRIIRYKTSTVYIAVGITIAILSLSILAFFLSYPNIALVCGGLTLANMLYSMYEFNKCENGREKATEKMTEIIDNLTLKTKLICVEHLIQKCYSKEKEISNLIEKGNQCIHDIKKKNMQLETMLKRRFDFNLNFKNAIQLNLFKIDNEESVIDENKLKKIAISNALRFLNNQKLNIKIIINESKKESSGLEIKMLFPDLPRISAAPTKLEMPNPKDKQDKSKIPIVSNISQSIFIKPRQKLIEQKPNIKTLAVLEKLEAKMIRKMSELKGKQPAKKNEETKGNIHTYWAESTNLIKAINSNIEKCKSNMELADQVLSQIQKTNKDSKEIKVMEKRAKQFILEIGSKIARGNEQVRSSKQILDDSKKAVDLYKQNIILTNLATEFENHAERAKYQYNEILEFQLELTAQKVQKKESEDNRNKNIQKNIAQYQHNQNLVPKLKILGIDNNKDDFLFDIYKSLKKTGAALKIHGSAVIEFARHKFHLASKEVKVNDIDLSIKIDDAKSEKEIMAILTSQGFLKGKENRYYIQFSTTKNGKRLDLTIQRPDFDSYNPIHISRQHIIYDSNSEWKLVDQNEELENALTNSVLDSDLPKGKDKATMLFSRYIKHRQKFPTFDLSENFKTVLYSYEWQAQYFMDKLSVTGKDKYRERDSCYAEIFSLIEQGYLKTFHCHKIICAFFTALLKEEIGLQPSLLVSNLATIINDYFIENPIVVDQYSVHSVRVNFFNAIDYLIHKTEYFRNKLDDDAKKFGFNCIQAILENQIDYYEFKESNQSISSSPSSPVFS